MALEAHAITFGYPGNERIIDKLSLTLERGERLVINAPSGTGKTTLCRILAGYEQPRSGEVLVDGYPLPKQGMCPVQLIGQHPENVLDPRLRMRETLEEAGLEPLPGNALLVQLGIKDEWLARLPHELSGGELQRFCIARALATEPQYLICDEISTMLDAVTQATIWHFLLSYVHEHNVGLIAVTHSSSLAAHIEQVSESGR